MEGNQTKMRGALVRIKHLFRDINLCEDTLGNEAYAIADAALASPPLNCNRFATWQEAKAAFWREVGDPADWQRLLEWLYAHQGIATPAAAPHQSFAVSSVPSGHSILTKCAGCGRTIEVLAMLDEIDPSSKTESEAVK